MNIVVDSNRVIASLLKDSTTREILYNRSFYFIAPEFVKEEIKNKGVVKIEKIEKPVQETPNTEPVADDEDDYFMNQLRRIP